MEIIAYQFSQLAAAILFGFFLGLYFDIYGLLLSLGKIKKKARGVLDLLWGASAFFVLFFLWYNLFSWSIRVILLFWLAFGFCFYWVLVHPSFARLKARLIPKTDIALKRLNTAKWKPYFYSPLKNWGDLFFKPACFFWHGWNFSRKGFDYTLKSIGQTGKKFSFLGRKLFPKRRGNEDDEEFIDN